MSESRRELAKMSSPCLSSRSHHSNNDSDRKRSHREMNVHQIDDLDRTVYVGNLPGEKLTDEELIHFFKPYGKICDIRVFKDHLLVQYHRVDQANKLIEQGQRSLTFRSNQLEIYLAKECRSKMGKSSSSIERSSKRTSQRNDESIRKRVLSKDHYHSSDLLSHNCRQSISSSKCSDDLRIAHQRCSYSILSGPTNSQELVDCQILIVNIRQRKYADEIESRLISSALRTSIRLLREDLTLTEAIQNATNERCLYAIVAMPMHEERRTASFHILYGQTEEHRNLTLEDGYHIILTNYLSYNERLHQIEVNSSSQMNSLLISSEEISANQNIYQSNQNSVEETNSLPILTATDKFPLSMLLCLLADGRQLTLNEIDRTLVYLLEKKAKMLTLPEGTLPPLPVQYATKNTSNYSTEKGSSTISNGKRLSKGEIESENCLSSSIAEQIRQILSTNIVSTQNSVPMSMNCSSQITKSCLESIPNRIKIEQTIDSSVNQDYCSQQRRQSHLTYSNPIVSSENCFVDSTYSSLKSTTIGTNSHSQTSDYIYSFPSTNLYSLPVNSSLTNSIYQSYSPITSLPILTSSTINQQINNSQQQTKQEK